MGELCSRNRRLCGKVIGRKTKHPGRMRERPLQLENRAKLATTGLRAGAATWQDPAGPSLPDEQKCHFYPDTSEKSGKEYWCWLCLLKINCGRANCSSRANVVI